MTKLLIIIALTVGLVFWFRHMAAGKRGDASRPPDARAPEDMVRCQVCGVNMPRSEALLSRGRYYCCEEHRRNDVT